MEDVTQYVKEHPLIPITSTAFALFFFASLYKKIFPSLPPTSSVAIGAAKPGESSARRNKAHREILSSPDDSTRTLHDILLRSVKKYGKQNAMGWREIVKTISEDKEMVTKDDDGNEKKEMKKWIYYQLSEYKWISYEEVFERVQALGNGLVSKDIGLIPKKVQFGIFCNTCPQWFLVAHGCFVHSIPVVTVYANLGEEGLVHAIHEGELTHLFCNAELLPLIKKVLPECPTLKCVIFVDKPSSGAIENLQSAKIKCVSYDELLKIGKQNPTEPLPAKSDDIAFIMYTSGTTDLPKGVMMTHANMIGAAGGASRVVEAQKNDLYIAYLPLAHVLELIVENFMLYAGVPIGYANTKTLIDSAVRDCKGDLNELRPTLMAGVPAVWERIRRGAMTKIEHSSIVVRTLFNVAYKYKSFMLRSGSTTPIVDAIVFSKFRAQVGGNVRAILSGGAPISKESHQFLRACFSCPVVQGYGLTECCGLATLQDLKDPGYDKVGPPVPCTEIKLLDVPEMKYFSTDKPFQRGEIVLRGPNVTLGYFKNEKKTNEDFKNGWFYTGDIGQWNADGTLSVIDRKKNLVKLSHGEYVALEKLESKFKQLKFIENMMVYGDSKQEYLVAIVVPVKSDLESWAKSNGVSGSYDEICKSKEAKKMVLDKLKEISKKEGMKSIETVGNVFLCSEEWTPENDMVTAAQKIKRQPIAKKYEKEIEAMYKKK